MSDSSNNCDVEKGLSSEGDMATASPVFGGPKSLSVSKHVFQIHNYKRPTFCAHCGGLLVGVIKQGMRCKRCEVDVHEKCQEDLKKSCIEVIVGNHNFREKTYKSLTYCDYCEKLLVGVVNQGLRCSECGANVHEKCQEKINVTCDKVKHRKKAGKSPVQTSFQRGRGSRTSTKRPKITEKTPLAASMGKLTEENVETSLSDNSYKFDMMPAPHSSNMYLSPSSLPSSPTRSPKQERSRSLGPEATTLQKQVDEVTGIMKANVNKMTERGEKLDNLKDKSTQLEECSKIFQTNAKDIKKKYWLKNKKLWIGIVVALLLLIVVIVIVVVIKTQTSTSQTITPSSKSRQTNG